MASRLETELSPPAREVAEALKAWYRETAIAWWQETGRDTATCDDGMDEIKTGEGYLRPGGYLCCEEHTDAFLCLSSWEENEKLADIQGWFGPGVPEPIEQLAKGLS